MCPLVTNEGDKEDSRVVLNYVNDINATYTEVLQVQSQNYEPLYTYTYGMQRIANDKENDTLLYYQYDARGSVIGQQKEDSSALHLKISYNDYGKPNRNLNNEYGYNAEAHDYNGTQYLRARYYNTDTGRFDQQDSYRGEQNNPVSQNRYTYVWNSPNQYIDKSGKSASQASNESIHAFNTLVDIEKSQNKGFSEKCLQWRVALSVADDPFMQFQGGLRGMAYFHAVDVKNFFLYQHGVPRCDVDPPYETPNWADEHNETHHGDNETVAEARRRADEERQRKEAEVNAIKEELENAGINLSGFDFSSMSLDERLQLLRHIKKICEDYGLGTENWDKDAAQEIVDLLVPENGSSPYSGGYINSRTIFSFANIRIQVPSYILEQQVGINRTSINSNLTTLQGLTESLNSLDWPNLIDDIGKVISLLGAIIAEYGFMVSGSMMGLGIIYILLTTMTAPRYGALTEEEWNTLNDRMQKLAKEVLSLVTIDILRKVVNDGFWGKGTYFNSKVNFIIHFAKHRKDKYIQMEYDPLGYYVLSLVAYMGIIGKSPDWYPTGPASQGDPKYMSISTKRFAIIKVEGREKVVSFGGN